MINYYDENNVYLNKDVVYKSWYRKPNAFRIYIYLLGKALTETTYLLCEKIEKGQAVTSFSCIAIEFGITNRAVKSALKKLEKAGDISVKECIGFLVITITDFAPYQPEEED